MNFNDEFKIRFENEISTCCCSLVAAQCYRVRGSEGGERKTGTMAGGATLRAEHK